MYNDNDLEFTYSIHEDVSDIPMIEREGVLPNNFNIVKELLELNSDLTPLNEETFQDRANKAVLSLELMDIDKFIKALVEIKVFDDTNVRNLLTKMQKDNNEVSPKKLLKRYKATLLESKELKEEYDNDEEIVFCVFNQLSYDWKCYCPAS